MFLLYIITVEIRHNMYESTLWLTLYNYSSSSAIETHVMKLLRHSCGADVNATGCYCISKALRIATIFHFMYNLLWFLNTFILQQWKTLLQYQTKIQWAVLNDSFFHRRL